MIKANGEAKFIPLYEALASEVRWRIMDLIADSEMNVKDIAAALELSPSIVTKHIRKLEQAGLIDSRRIRLNGGTHKLCFLKQNNIEIEPPSPIGQQELENRQFQWVTILHLRSILPAVLGRMRKKSVFGMTHATFLILSGCKLPSSGLEGGMSNKKRLTIWLPDQTASAIVISVEMASEAPGLRDHWPSDILFTFNAISLGTWTSPADFGRAARGKYTPTWWHRNVNQYGLLKTIRVDDSGTYMDGERMSDVTIEDIKLEEPFWTLRFTVDEEGANVGGLTLYGSGFGNHDQDIVIRVQR